MFFLYSILNMRQKPKVFNEVAEFIHLRGLGIYGIMGIGFTEFVRKTLIPQKKDDVSILIAKVSKNSAFRAIKARSIFRNYNLILHGK